MTSRAKQWKRAFARQSLSDLRVYQVLCRQGGGISHCQRLHYLQMHLEKLAKAFLWDQSKDEKNIGDLHRTHNVIMKALPLIMSKYWQRTGYGGAPDRYRIEQFREICRQIDLLCPSVDDDGRRPDNVEYPWPSRTSREVIVPCDYKFPVDQRLHSLDGRMLLRTAAAVAEMLAEEQES